MADDAVTRKHQRLMDEAVGAQHNSPAALALAQFNRDLVSDPARVKAEAEEEEARGTAQGFAAIEEAEAADHDDDDDDDDEDEEGVWEEK